VPNILVLAGEEDRGAVAVAQALTTAGRLGVALVQPAVLALARWRQHIGASGRVQTQLMLADGRCFKDSDIAVVFNRLRYLSVPQFTRSSARDREYAAQEFQALVGSWLHGIGCPVVNEGQARAIGWQRSLTQWLALAASCGLPVLPATRGTSARVMPPAGSVCTTLEALPATALIDMLVLGGMCHGPLATQYGEACSALARRSGCVLLACTFGLVAGTYVLAAVNPYPSLLVLPSVTVVAGYLETLARKGTRHDPLFRSA
jgi:hypothetical protein